MQDKMPKTAHGAVQEKSNMDNASTILQDGDLHYLKYGSLQ